MMKVYLLTPLLICLLFPTASFIDKKPPHGWRFPAESDYKGDWQDYRKDVPVPFHVHADFNGDGIDDDAWLLIKKNSPGWGLFVFLARKGSEPEVIQLSESPDSTSIYTIGISLVEPGTYATACGKGYWGCGPDEPAKLVLKLPAIRYFRHESFEWYYYWDRDTNRFRSVAISD